MATDQLIVELLVDASQANAGANAFEQSANRIEQASTRATASVDRLGQALDRMGERTQQSGRAQAATLDELAGKFEDLIRRQQSGGFNVLDAQVAFSSLAQIRQNVSSGNVPAAGTIAAMPFDRSGVSQVVTPASVASFVSAAAASFRNDPVAARSITQATAQAEINDTTTAPLRAQAHAQEAALAPSALPRVAEESRSDLPAFQRVVEAIELSSRTNLAGMSGVGAAFKEAFTRLQVPPAAAAPPASPPPPPSVPPPRPISEIERESVALQHGAAVRYENEQSIAGAAAQHEIATAAQRESEKSITDAAALNARGPTGIDVASWQKSRQPTAPPNAVNAEAFNASRPLPLSDWEKSLEEGGGATAATKTWRTALGELFGVVSSGSGAMREGAAAADELGNAHGRAAGGGRRLYEGMVLFHEAASGRWRNAISSLTIELANFGALGYVFNPITIGIAGVTGALAVLISRSAEIDANLRSFTATIRLMGTGSQESAQGLENQVVSLRHLGLTAEDAKKSVDAVARTPGITPAARPQIESIGTRISQYLDDDAAAQHVGDLAKATAGGVEGLVRFGEAFNAFTEQEIHSLRELDRAGQSQLAIGQALDILDHKIPHTTELLSEFQNATKQLKNAWGDMLDALAKSPPVEGTIKALTSVFQAATTPTGEAALGGGLAGGVGLALLGGRTGLRLLPRVGVGLAAGGATAAAGVLAAGAEGTEGAGTDFDFHSNLIRNVTGGASLGALLAAPGGVTVPIGAGIGAATGAAATVLQVIIAHSSIEDLATAMQALAPPGSGNPDFPELSIATRAQTDAAKQNTDALLALALKIPQTSPSEASVSQPGDERRLGSPQAYGGTVSTLIDALVQAESRGKTDAVDKVTGTHYGLTQLALPTAQEISPGVTKEQLLTEGSLNRSIGTEYLRRQIVEFGSLFRGLEAYNAGPNALRRQDAGVENLKPSVPRYADGIVRAAGLTGRETAAELGFGLSGPSVTSTPTQRDDAAQRARERGEDVRVQGYTPGISQERERAALEARRSSQKLPPDVREGEITDITATFDKEAALRDQHEHERLERQKGYLKEENAALASSLEEGLQMRAKNAAAEAALTRGGDPGRQTRDTLVVQARQALAVGEEQLRYGEERVAGERLVAEASLRSRDATIAARIANEAFSASEDAIHKAGATRVKDLDDQAAAQQRRKAAELESLEASRQTEAIGGALTANRNRAEQLGMQISLQGQSPIEIQRQESYLRARQELTDHYSRATPEARGQFADSASQAAEINAQLAQTELHQQRIDALFKGIADTVDNQLGSALRNALIATPLQASEHLHNYWRDLREGLRTTLADVASSVATAAFIKPVTSLVASGLGLGKVAQEIGGFATGGHFHVGGSGGTDTTHVEFMATPGERVIVLTPSQAAHADNTGKLPHFADGGMLDPVTGEVTDFGQDDDQVQKARENLNPLGGDPEAAVMAQASLAMQPAVAAIGGAIADQAREFGQAGVGVAQAGLKSESAFLSTTVADKPLLGIDKETGEITGRIPALADFLQQGLAGGAPAGTLSSGIKLGGEAATASAAASTVNFASRTAVKGKPTGIIGYHGSPHDFDQFDPSKVGQGNYGQGTYFHTAEADANRYRFDGGRTYEANLNVVSPYRMDTPVSADDAASILEALGSHERAAAIRESGAGYRSGSELWYWGLGQQTPITEKAAALQKAGYDAVIGDPGLEIAGKSTRSPEINVFDPTAIEILRKIPPPPPPPLAGIVAYHGSPHDFDKFDISKIGTGEAAQAYGHGLYFAEHEPVAKGYRDALAPRKQAFSDALDASDLPTAVGSALKDVGTKQLGHLRDPNSVVSSAYMQVPEARDFIRANRDSAISAVRQAQEAADKAGHMYEVRLNVQPDQLLHWDKPLNEQSPQVQAAVTKTGITLTKPQPTGQDVYRTLAEQLATRQEELNVPGVPRGWAAVAGAVNDRAYNPLAASRTLQEAGIPGIRYLDQGSRGAGEGSHNIVMFGDENIDILRKYGLAGPPSLAQPPPDTEQSSPTQPAAGGFFNGDLPMLATGGTVAQTGVAVVHAGEVVLPTEKTDDALHSVTSGLQGLSAVLGQTVPGLQALGRAASELSAVSNIFKAGSSLFSGEEPSARAALPSLAAAQSNQSTVTVNNLQAGATLQGPGQGGTINQSGNQTTITAGGSATAALPSAPEAHAALPSQEPTASASLPPPTSAAANVFLPDTSTVINSPTWPATTSKIELPSTAVQAAEKIVIEGATGSKASPEASIAPKEPGLAPAAAAVTGTEHPATQAAAPAASSPLSKLSSLGTGVSLIDKLNGSLPGFLPEFLQGGGGGSVGSFLSNPFGLFASQVPAGEAISQGLGPLAANSAGNVTVPGLFGTTATFGSFAAGAGLGFGAGSILNTLVGGNAVGGTAGSAGGALLGAAIGSFLPVIGTALGGLIGGSGGGLLGGLVGGPPKGQSAGAVVGSNGQLSFNDAGGSAANISASSQVAQQIGAFSRALSQLTDANGNPIGILSGNTVVSSNNRQGLQVTGNNISGGTFGQNADQAVQQTELQLIHSLSNVSGTTLATVLHNIGDPSQLQNAVQFADVYDKLNVTSAQLTASLTGNVNAIGPFQQALVQVNATFNQLSAQANQFGVDASPIAAALKAVSATLNQDFRISLDETFTSAIDGGNDFLASLVKIHQTYVQATSDAQALADAVSGAAAAQSQAATAAAPEAASPAAATGPEPLRTFANGGVTPSGWILVGERGPEWMLQAGGATVLPNGVQPPAPVSSVDGTASGGLPNLAPNGRSTDVATGSVAGTVNSSSVPGEFGGPLSLQGRAFADGTIGVGDVAGQVPGIGSLISQAAGGPSLLEAAGGALGLGSGTLSTIGDVLPIAGPIVGGAIAALTGHPVQGAIGTASSLIGFALGGPVGGVIGGLVGLLGNFIGPKPSNKASGDLVDLASGTISGFQSAGNKNSDSAVAQISAGISAIATAFQAATGGTISGAVNVQDGSRDGIKTSYAGPLGHIDAKWGSVSEAIGQFGLAIAHGLQGIDPVLQAQLSGINDPDQLIPAIEKFSGKGIDLASHAPANPTSPPAASTAAAPPADAAPSAAPAPAAPEPAPTDTAGAASVDPGVVAETLFEGIFRTHSSAFANGGTTPPGWILVGERGPEWMLQPGGATVLPNGVQPSSVPSPTGRSFADGTITQQQLADGIASGTYFYSTDINGYIDGAGVPVHVDNTATTAPVASAASASPAAAPAAAAVSPVAAATPTTTVPAATPTNDLAALDKEISGTEAAQAGTVLAGLGLDQLDLVIKDLGTVAPEIAAMAQALIDSGNALPDFLTQGIQALTDPLDLAIEKEKAAGQERVAIATQTGQDLVKVQQLNSANLVQAVISNLGNTNALNAIVYPNNTKALEYLQAAPTLAGLSGQQLTALSAKLGDVAPDLASLAQTFINTGTALPDTITQGIEAAVSPLKLAIQQQAAQAEARTQIANVTGQDIGQVQALNSISVVQAILGQINNPEAMQALAAKGNPQALAQLQAGPVLAGLGTDQLGALLTAIGSAAPNLTAMINALVASGRALPDALVQATQQITSAGLYAVEKARALGFEQVQTAAATGQSIPEAQNLSAAEIAQAVAQATGTQLPTNGLPDWISQIEEAATAPLQLAIQKEQAAGAERVAIAQATGENLVRVQKANANAIAEVWYQATASLTSLKNQITTGSLSGLTAANQVPASLEQFNQILALVQAGNTNFINDLASAGQAAVQAAQTAYGNGPQTASVREQVLAAIQPFLVSASGYPTSGPTAAGASATTAGTGTDLQQNTGALRDLTSAITGTTGTLAGGGAGAGAAASASAPAASGAAAATSGFNPSLTASLDNLMSIYNGLSQDMQAVYNSVVGSDNGTYNNSGGIGNKVELAALLQGYQGLSPDLRSQYDTTVSGNTGTYNNSASGVANKLNLVESLYPSVTPAVTASALTAATSTAANLTSNPVTGQSFTGSGITAVTPNYPTYPSATALSNSLADAIAGRASASEWTIINQAVQAGILDPTHQPGYASVIEQAQEFAAGQTLNPSAGLTQALSDAQHGTPSLQEWALINQAVNSGVISPTATPQYSYIIQQARRIANAQATSLSQIPDNVTPFNTARAGLPSFAAGTAETPPGLIMVGERGPEWIRPAANDNDGWQLVGAHGPELLNQSGGATILPFPVSPPGFADGTSGWHSSQWVAPATGPTGGQDHTAKALEMIGERLAKELQALRKQVQGGQIAEAQGTQTGHQILRQINQNVGPNISAPARRAVG